MFCPYEVAEHDVLKPGQRNWLGTLRAYITRNYCTAGADDYCERIGLPYVLFRRSGDVEAYRGALEQWRETLTRKHLLARLGG